MSGHHVTYDSILARSGDPSKNLDFKGRRSHDDSFSRGHAIESRQIPINHTHEFSIKTLESRLFPYTRMISISRYVPGARMVP